MKWVHVSPVLKQPPGWAEAEISAVGHSQLIDCVNQTENNCLGWKESRQPHSPHTSALAETSHFNVINGVRHCFQGRDTVRKNPAGLLFSSPYLTPTPFSFTPPFFVSACFCLRVSSSHLAVVLSPFAPLCASSPHWCQIYRSFCHCQSTYWAQKHESEMKEGVLQERGKDHIKARQKKTEVTCLWVWFVKWLLSQQWLGSEGEHFNTHRRALSSLSATLLLLQAREIPTLSTHTQKDLRE